MARSLILVLNAGASSLKYAVYEAGDTLLRLSSGRLESTDAAVQMDRIAAEAGAAGDAIVAVGHRIVHGGATFAEPARLDDETRAALEALVPLAPLHLPANLAGVARAEAAFPGALQVGCFDTAFHRGHATVADRFALPRNLWDRGIRRYGFHGLSYAFVASALAKTDLASARVIVAHLGNGASLCAMAAGRSVATTMGFSALDGLMMGTRPGRVDPGVLLHLMREGMDAPALSRLLYHESGLLGDSGISNDMQVLEASKDPRAAEAIALYCHTIRGELAGLTAQLGGLDAVVFTGGVGENSARIRAEVCEGMDWLGLSVAAERNVAGAEFGTGPVRLLVLPTDEEQVIARATHAAFVAGTGARGSS